MEQSRQEQAPVKKDLLANVRERMWKVVRKDALSQRVRRQWREVSRAAAAQLDAPSLAKLKMRLSDNADRNGKDLAIAARAMDIITTTLFGALGIHDVGAAIIANRKPDAYMHRNPIMTQYARGILEGVAAVTTIGLRPAEYGYLYAGKAGVRGAEKVARIVNTIAKKREASIARKQMFVGQAKA